jgi:hypothetical protein
MKLDRGVMKKIALITDIRNSQLGDVLSSDLREVLSGHAEIRNYFFESLKSDEPIEADVVLVTTQSRALEIQNHVTEARRILVVQRTIRESDAYRIFSIPPGTPVLVVNNLPETTMETVALMQQIEFDHLQFIPYEEGMDCSDIHIAITPGERNLVPASITTIIDIGHRLHRHLHLHRNHQPAAHRGPLHRPAAAALFPEQRESGHRGQPPVQGAFQAQHRAGHGHQPGPRRHPAARQPGKGRAAQPGSGGDAESGRGEITGCGLEVFEPEIQEILAQDQNPGVDRRNQGAFHCCQSPGHSVLRRAQRQLLQFPGSDLHPATGTEPEPQAQGARH